MLRCCAVGTPPRWPNRNNKHDGLRDFCAGDHQRATGHVAQTEQRVVAWDRVNPRSGRLEEARLDVATRDAVTGQTAHFPDLRHLEKQ